MLGYFLVAEFELLKLRVDVEFEVFDGFGDVFEHFCEFVVEA